MASRKTTELVSGCRLIGVAQLPAAAAECHTANELAELLVSCSASGKAEELSQLLTIYRALHNKYFGNKKPSKDSVVSLWKALEPKIIGRAVVSAASAGHANCLAALLDANEDNTFPEEKIPLKALSKAAEACHWDAVLCLLQHAPGRVDKEKSQEMLPGVVRACIRADAAECLKVALRLPKSLRASFLDSNLFTHACRCDSMRCCSELLALEGEQTVDPRENDDAPIQAAARFGNMHALEVLLELNDAWHVDSVAIFVAVETAVEHDQMPVLLRLLRQDSDEDACLEKYGVMYCRTAARHGRRLMLAEICAEARRQGLTLFPDWEKEDEALRAQLQQGTHDASWFSTARCCGRKHVLLHRLQMRQSR